VDAEADTPPLVSFHTGVNETVGHTERLVRKAVSQGLRVCVTARPEVVAELDERLWTAVPDSFMPHAVWNGTGLSVALLKHTGVWLWPSTGDGELPWPPDLRATVWVNVATDVQFQRPWDKHIEVVPAQGEGRGLGQRRWTRFKQLGWRVEHHAVTT